MNKQELQKAAVTQSLIKDMGLTEEQANHAVSMRGIYESELDCFKENNRDELREARKAGHEDEFWLDGAGEIAEGMYGQIKFYQRKGTAGEILSKVI